MCIRDSHNVGLTYVAVVMECLAMSCWAGTVLSAFLYDITGKNWLVGLTAAAMGLVQLVGAYPVGWAADRYGKARFVRVGGMLSPIAIGASSFAVVYGTAHGQSDDAPSERMTAYWFMFSGQCIFGLVFLAAAGPLLSLIHISEPTRPY